MSENAVEVRGKAEFVDVGDREFKGGARIHGFKVNGTKYTAFIKSEKPIQNAKVGDTVKFTADVNQKGYWNFDPETFELLERGNTQPTQKQNYPQNDDNRQQSIVRQSSVGYASNVVAAFAQSGFYEKPDDAVSDMIRLADHMIYPYAMEGKIDGGENNAPNDGPSEDDMSF